MEPKAGGLQKLQHSLGLNQEDLAHTEKVLLTWVVNWRKLMTTWAPDIDFIINQILCVNRNLFPCFIELVFLAGEYKQLLGLKCQKLSASEESLVKKTWMF